MNKEPQTTPGEQTIEAQLPSDKTCAHCGERKPLSHFMRRTGRRAGPGSRRGACRACRQGRRQVEAANERVRTMKTEAQAAASATGSLTGAATRRTSLLAPDADGTAEPPPAPRPRTRRPLPQPPPMPEGPDASVLRPTREGIVRMRGRTDKGRRWHQETDLETAVTLVRERAAVVVNRHTIRRIYSNKTFRQYILTRDKYTCHFCGDYGDTIDHLLPRAKGGHTTPVNCVCACNLCNQSKADRSLDEFLDD